MEEENSRKEVEKPRILTFSNSVMSHSGFGTVVKNILMRLTPEYDVFSVGMEHLTAQLKYLGINCLPTGHNANIGGAEIIPEYLEIFKPKYFITCTDLHQLGFFDVKDSWIKYVTIDTTPIHHGFHNLLRKGYLNVVPNRFSYDELVGLDIPVKYIPFGVNADVYRPKKGKEFAGLKGKFIFGCVGRNTERKRWDRLLRAFASIWKDCRDAVLVCVTDPREQLDYAFDAQELAKSLGIGSKVFFPSHVSVQRAGLTDEHMSEIYNAFDVHVNVADREGFGLPILESMSCGVPNIVNGYSAPPEIIKDSGLITKVADWSFHSPFNYKGALVDIEALAENMLILYDDRKLRNELGRKSRKRAVEYDWDVAIIPKWKELLESEFLQEI